MAAKHNNPGAEEAVEAGSGAGDTGADISKQENHRDLSTNGEYLADSNILWPCDICTSRAALSETRNHGIVCQTKEYLKCDNSG